MFAAKPVHALRLRPLGACLALGLSGSLAAATSSKVDAGGHRTSAPATYTASELYALMDSAAGLFLDALPTQPTATLTVKNCNDSGPDSLREAVASAPDGSVIEFDMNAMGCSKITLTTGQLDIAVRDLSIAGPGAQSLTIDGGYASQHFNRIFNHNPNPIGTLRISDLTLTNAKYRSNSGTVLGGCVYASGQLHAEGVVIKNCGAIGDGVPAAGGGIWARGLILVRSVVSDNIVMSDLEGRGGGIATEALGFAVKYSDVSNNEIVTFALKPIGAGGGVYTNAATESVIAQSTISGNRAEFGGGLEINGDLALTNSTLSGNQVSRYYGGADVAGKAVIGNSTIVFNTSAVIGDRPAGIGAASIESNSSILAHNQQNDGNQIAEMDAGSGDGNITGKDNLILTTAPMTTPPLNTSTDCPRLAPLLDNGGLTRTHALLPHSAAIDFGSNADALGTDQRGNGFARIVGSVADMGAFEWSEGSGEVIQSGGFEYCDF